MLAPTRVFRQFEQYAKPVPGQTGAGFVVSGGVFALQRFYKMYRVDDAQAVGVGRRVSSGKAEREAEVRFLGLPGGNLQKYIDNYMLLH